MAGSSLADNAILGIVLGVCLAFPVLVLSTCNVINGLLATLTICCVTVCVIGVLPMAGWNWGGYNLFPANFENLPMELHDEPWLKRDLAWTARDDYSNRVVRSLPASKTTSWYRGLTREGLLLFYYKDGGNVFTQASLQQMQQIENALVNVPYFTDHCQLQAQNGSCVPPVSVLRFFDGTYASVDPVFTDTTFSNIGPVLYAASTYNETKSAFLYALGKSNEITPTSVTTTLTRTLIPLGWPLAGYSDEDAMLTVLTEFMADHMQPTLESFLDVGVFEFTYYNTRLMYHDVQKQAYSDMALALGSLVFIFFFILFHTRSLWITCMAELSIISSFVETNLIYRVVLDFRYFGYFHVLALFIILGIGADDLFVFWDAWTATGLKSHPSLAHRLNEAYRKSVISMLVTSLTTMTAFVANALSPLLATRSFGIFAAILVGIDYLSVITFFPTIVIFYHRHFEDKPHPCCCCWNKKDKDKADTSSAKKDNSPNPHLATVTKYGTSSPEPTQNGHVTPLERQNTNSQLFRQDTKSKLLRQDSKGKQELVRQDSKKLFVSPARNSVHPDTCPTQPVFVSLGLKTADVTSSPVAPKDNTSTTCKDRVTSCCRTKRSSKRSRLVVFFSDYYFRFVTHKVARWVIVVALLGCLAGFAYSASRLEPDNEQIQLYTDSHHYTKAIKHNNYGFVPNDVDRTITIHLVWGLGEQDMSSCHFSEVECPGTQVYDDNFQASTQAAQQAFVDICDALFSMSASEASDYRIKRDILTGELEISCFPRNMKTFLQSDPVSGSVDVSMPWNWTETMDFMTSLSTYYDTSVFNSSYTHHLDIPLTYWLWDAYQQNNTEDWQLFNSLVGEETGPFTTNILTSSSIQVGNKIKYLAIAVNTTLQLQSLGYEEGIPIVQRWEKFMESQLSNMPTEMRGGFQTTTIAWHWLYVQKSLADNAILGIVLCVFAG
nr:hypothetical protein BaRGS_029051 [Batillaria attramentaria]